MSIRATLTVMGGLPDQAGQVFEVGAEAATLGRGLNCDIQLADQSISRLHAEVVWEGETLVLVHKSQVNRTLVNGTQITERTPLAGGEEIQLADRVVLRLKLEVEEDEAEAPAAIPVPEVDATQVGSVEAPAAPIVDLAAAAPVAEPVEPAPTPESAPLVSPAVSEPPPAPPQADPAPAVPAVAPAIAAPPEIQPSPPEPQAPPEPKATGGDLFVGGGPTGVHPVPVHR